MAVFVNLNHSNTGIDRFGCVTDPTIFSVWFEKFYVNSFQIS